MSRRTVFGTLVVCAALAGSGSQAGAQTLTVECSGDLDAQCRRRVELADSLQQALITLRVIANGKPVLGAVVRLRASAGALQPDSTTSDAEGYARTIWFRSKGRDPVAVVAEARSGAAAGLASIRLTPDTAVPAPTKTVVLEQRSGFSQSWFEKGQLPRPVAVELRFAQPTGGRATARIEDAAACAANRVVFARRGAAASVSPDSVPGVLDDDRCYARTYWSLGEGIGERELHISVLPGKGYKAEAQPLVANAWARATPRFVAGLAYSRLRPYLGLTPATQRSVQVEETDATGVKRTYTTNEVVRPAAVDTVGRKEQYSAVAALSIPIPIARLGDADGLSLTGGVDLAAPTNRFYAGLSVLRLFGHLNPVIESLPVDLHLLGYFARQPVLRDSNCAPADCTVRDRMRYHGLSVMLSGDATSLISELVKKLAP